MGRARAAFILTGVAGVAASVLGLVACDGGSPAAPGVDAAPQLVDATTSPVDGGDAASTDAGDGAIDAGPPSLSAGGFHTCSLRGGEVKCWGSNVFGELGNGSHLPSVMPVPTVVIGGVTSGVVHGVWHACGLAGTTAVCWGANSNDELGHDQARELDAGDTYDAADARAGVWAMRASTSVPAPVTGLDGVVAFSLGSGYSCALVDAGTVSCWGSDLAGVLGATDGGRTCAPPIGGPCSPTPRAIAGVTGVSQIAAAEEPAACALRGSDGTVWCWGNNADGVLGPAADGGSGPVQVQGLANVKQLAAGDRHFCALLSDGTVSCWGYGYLGELGRDAGGCSAFSCPLSPAVVGGLTSVTQVGCGEGFSCALRSDGTVACWGQNGYGQLGSAVDAGQSYVPQTITGVSGATQMAVGASHVCALGADASVVCWGGNGSGELGPGTDAGFTKVPVPVTGL
jgi:alpha-tubulin suppressor-like RCC1 family protein